MKNLKILKFSEKGRGFSSPQSSMSSFISVAIISISLLAPVTSHAETPEFYEGTRELGMGGAYTGVVDDSTAVLTNPAGLGKIRDVTITLADPQLEGSFTDTQIMNSSNATQMTDPQTLLNNLNQNKGVPFHLLGQVFPSIVGPNFGFGILGKESYDAMVDSTGTNFQLNYTRDFAAALGFCLRFFGGIVKIGVAGRVIDRTQINQTLPANSTTLSMSSLESEGLGVGTDLGLILAAPIAGLPSLSATVRDVGGTSYNLTNGMFDSTSSRPAMTPSTIDGGLSVFPILSNHVRMSITAEYHDIATASTEQDQIRRVHAGVEFNFADFFFLRGGMNGRYWTAGVELSTERFQLQAASYGEEVGTYPVNQEDRRWVASIGLRF
jgi:hypothetical protein